MNRMTQEQMSRFGLIGTVETKRVVLPLKGVQCEFKVCAGVASVRMTQIFLQENRAPMDCQYCFPLPADASVYFCEADINGRKIRAKVEEREAARKLAAQKKAEGYRTALVESERDNFFTLSLTNLQTNDLIVVELKYIQPLRAMADEFSLEVPFCPGIRYIPGQPLLRSNRGNGFEDDTNEVPDASRISPPRIDALHPDAAYVDVQGALDGDFVAAEGVRSLSHSVVCAKLENGVAVTLSDKGEVPDRNFVLRWSEKETAEVAPRAWIQERNGELNALLEIRAPRVATQDTTIDFYFLVDRSTSMQGMKWVKAAEALQSCVKTLGPNDRAMITFFETGLRDFAEKPLSAASILADTSFKNIVQIGVTGGTEMLPALRHVLATAEKHSAGRQKNLILITDAQVGNESAILAHMNTVRDFPVHCFGIDIALNDSLLQALARQQGGTFHSLHPNDDIAAAVTKLAKTLRTPVLVDLKLPEGWEPAEAHIPNLYAGQTVYVAARGPRSEEIVLNGKLADGQPTAIKFTTLAAGSAAPFLYWCKTRMQRLLSEGKNQEAIVLSVDSNMICLLTAFVAWDAAEKVAVATHELVQPVMGGLMESATHVAYSRMARVARVPQGISASRRIVGHGIRQQPDSDGERRSRVSGGKEEDWKAVTLELITLCEGFKRPEWKTQAEKIAAWALEGKEYSRMWRLVGLIEYLEPILNNFQVRRTQGKDVTHIEDEVELLLNCFLAEVAAKDP